MKKRSIVVVDDEVDFTDMVKCFLERTGLFEVGVCNTGGEALAMIRDWKPDLVLLDIVMPGMDGTEIAGKLRETEDLRSVPLMFSTSLVTPQEIARDPLIAKTPFISKPISGEALARRIREFFAIEDRP
ncbi:MAG: response regulator [Candidatus Omnitrophica bacterium]|nr:response regulator [Candidatus Omnitrophota bacterium]